VKSIQEMSYEFAQIMMKRLNDYHHTHLDQTLQILFNFANNKANHFFIHAQEGEKTTLFYLSIMLVIALFLNIIIALTTIRGIVIPIRELIGFTQGIYEGKVALYKNRTESKIAQREDEIGLLFKSFNKLMGDLLLPYEYIVKKDAPLVEQTDEVKRLLDSFDKYIIASKTDTKGIVTYVSQAFQDVTGYSSTELIGKSQNIIQHPDMPKEVFETLWQTISKGKPWNGYIKNKKKNGSYFWIRSTILPDIDSTGTIVGYNAISENVTDAVAYAELSKTLESRVQEELQKNSEQTAYMIQQSRLAQMGEMISMIAHQWRQPLASISAIAGTLSLDVMMKNYNEDFFEERLNSVSELSQYLSDTIDDFRSFFKKDKILEKVDVKDMVNACLQIIGSSLKNNNITIVMEIDENIILESYVNELKQVLLNIFKNAEDALCDHNTENATIAITGNQKESNVYLTIEDNAGGVPKEIIDKIFDPYFSTKKKKDGTGLGLYMSKTIIEEHCNGTLMLENSKIGACFTIILPIEHQQNTL
jgi:PAS domain S-box-containing protein